MTDQFLTGHNQLLKHQKAIGKVDVDLCCLYSLSQESVSLLLWHCSALGELREQLGIELGLRPEGRLLLALVSRLRDLSEPD